MPARVELDRWADDGGPVVDPPYTGQGLITIVLQLHGARRMARQFDRAMAQITRLARSPRPLWPELDLIRWPFPDFATYRRRPYDHEFDD